MITNDQFDKLIYVLGQISENLDNIAHSINSVHSSRDFFAAAVIQGIASEIDNKKHAVRWAYEVADEMLMESGN